MRKEKEEDFKKADESDQDGLNSVRIKRAVPFQLRETQHERPARRRIKKERCCQRAALGERVCLGEGKGVDSDPCAKEVET